jgi:hypothetical protein
VKSYKARELEEALKSHGFLLDRSTSDKIYYLWHGGRKTSVFTKVSHGSGEGLGHRLMAMIQRQLRLDSQGQLREFIEGTMDGPAYIVFLKAKLVIQDSPGPTTTRG